jgi:hypothetical protein
MAQFGDFTVDRNSTKYVLGSGGTIISYATDEPAFEFNADGSYKGLLVEPAATNICKQSEDFSTTWSPTEVTITTNDTTAPDGNSTADKLADNAVNQRHRVSTFISVTSGVTYTFSVFVKKESGGRFLLLNADAAFGAKAALNLDTLAVTDISGTSSIETYPNGWYRFSVTGTATSTATTPVYLQMQDSAADVSYVGDGSSFYIWGAQVETGPIATSYIPTTTAQVTRTKDDITLGSASSLIGQTEGTLYVEVDWRLATGVLQYILFASDGTSNNRFVIYNLSSPVELRMLAVANGVQVTNQGESSTAYSGIQKIALAYKTDDFELYRNGSSISSDTSGSLSALATLTDIDLGQDNSASLQVNMWIRAVALYPKRLSDAECEALTTL